MTSLSFRRAGASVLVLEAAYVLLICVAFAVSASYNPEPGPAESGPWPVLEAAAVALVICAAALLGLPALAKRVPGWIRAVVLLCTAAVQLYVVRAATANALEQGLEPDAVLNALMVLGALVATAACVLGLRAPAGRTAAGSPAAGV
ncbi:hypothetical protein ACIQCR_14885 [Streptomyces sp. NPDC093249]|uniref:hypothetical protein n=1 Tax=unclassified Streptomyces TaxID=2593676 RepID=UPI0038150FEC